MATVSDVEYITAKAMLSVYKKQAAFYEGRRTLHMGYQEAAEKASTTLDRLFWSSQIESDELMLHVANRYMSEAKGVIDKYEREHEATSTSLPDAEAVVHDQGQSAGAEVRSEEGGREADTLPDQVQDQVT